jgi:uncharacterized protein
MPISRAEIPVEDSQGVIERLCDEWSETQQVRRESERVCVIFAEGTCVLYPETDKLVVAIETLEEQSLDRLEGEVTRHLERMAGDEDLAIVWEN